MTGAAPAITAQAGRAAGSVSGLDWASVGHRLHAVFRLACCCRRRRRCLSGFCPAPGVVPSSLRRRKPQSVLVLMAPQTRNHPEVSEYELGLPSRCNLRAPAVALFWLLDVEFSPLPSTPSESARDPHCCRRLIFLDFSFFSLRERAV